MKRIISYLFPAIVILTIYGCSQTIDSGDFTEAEKLLISQSVAAHGNVAVPKGTMRVLTISDSDDNAILRTTSSDLSCKALLSEEYASLCSLMVATVTHPSQDGVGIAGPQVGLNRRVVAVQRFDKEGEPFEVYPNIRIVWASDSLAVGPEGCLSVPDRRGDVMRSTDIIIEYANVPSAKTGNCPDDCTEEREIQMVRDTVHGFTAVIFQHEIDHLEGILYIDRL